MKARDEQLLEGSSIGIKALHLCVLCGFALAQPLFDLFSRNAEFFVAHRAEPADILLFAGLLCFGLPAVIIIAEVTAGLLGRRMRKGVHGAAVACFVMLIALQVLKPLGGLPGLALVGAALCLGGGATLGYLRFLPVQMFLTVLSPAVLLFPGLFLLDSPVKKLLFPQQQGASAAVPIASPAPVIMVICDELSVTSLMDEHRQIDPVRFPNFAALAQNATWFRNATTVSPKTTSAIPAILDGQYPDNSRLPTLADHPHNLFTLLHGSYELNVLETATTLSPTTTYGEERPVRSLARRLRLMFIDLSVVYLHVLLPQDLSSGLPPVTQTWKDFLGGNKTAAVQTLPQGNDGKLTRFQNKDRLGLFEEWVDSITVAREPSLYFLHILFPHMPWEYSPSGKTYTRMDGMNIAGLDFSVGKWSRDDWLVIQGYQRYLWQVEIVDHLLGKLLAHLKKINLYENALIVFTADHGVSFLPDESRRGPTKANFADIMAIPLFIKAPQQQQGIISDRNVETIDIFPTIADILGIRLPWPVAGQSALDLSLPERKEKSILHSESGETLVFASSDLEAKYVTLGKKLALFGSGEKASRLPQIEPYSHLIGRQISELYTGEKTEVRVELDHPELFIWIEPESNFVPAYITGRLQMKELPETSFKLAVAINGTIQAVTRSWQSPSDQTPRWTALVDERAFRTGQNQVEVFLLSFSEGRFVLKGTTRRDYVLAQEQTDGHEVIIAPDGKAIPVVEAYWGWLESGDIADDDVVFSGWAADVQNSQHVEALLFFLNKKFLYYGQTNVRRPVIAEVLKKPALQQTGFYYKFPLALFRRGENQEVRIFALSKSGVASELKYAPTYRWKKSSPDE